MSDLNLLELHREIVRIRSSGRKLRRALPEGVRHDPSECPGLGSFRVLLDLLVEKFRWSEDEIAAPAALGLFVPSRLWTMEHISEIREAIDAVRSFMDSAPTERAWEFALAWLLGANGRAVDWKSDLWEGPMDAWSTLHSMVFDCVAVTCLYLGGSLKFRVGGLPRGTRVPNFNDYVGDQHLAEWTNQICEALTGKHGARCLCADLHSLFLEDKETAALEAAEWAKAKGLPKPLTLTKPNAFKKVETDASQHRLGAWDRSRHLTLFVRRAVRGGWSKVKPGEITSGMLFRLLRDATGLELALVAVRKCVSCTFQWHESHRKSNPDDKKKISDVISFDPDRCDQCEKPFGPNDFPFARRMLILSEPNSGFAGREVFECGRPQCGVVFTPDEAKTLPAKGKATKTCPKCAKPASQRKAWVNFWEDRNLREQNEGPGIATRIPDDANPPDHGGGEETDPGAQDAETFSDLSEGDFDWILELVEILVQRNHGKPFSTQPPLPEDAMKILEGIHGSPRNPRKLKSKWLASAPLWGALEDRALRSLNSGLFCGPQFDSRKPF